MVEALTGQSRTPFPGVIGQIAARNQLLRSISSGRLSHSYLLIGPEGVGKRALAIEVARVLNCPKGPESSAFGCDCHSCTSMLKWKHPNLLPIFPLPSLKPDKGEASDKALAEFLKKLETNPYIELHFAKTGRILIDHIREVRSKVSLSADTPGIRVLFIHPADRMNEESSNALLKLLEEPPEKCLLILTAENRRGLLPTILSRCQHIRLNPLTSSEIAAELIERKGIESDRAHVVAALAKGSYTSACQLLEQETETVITETLEFLRSAVVGNTGKIVESITKWTIEGISREEIKDRLDVTSLWIMDAMSTKASCETNEAIMLRIPDPNGSARKIADRYNLDQLVEALQELEETKLAIDSNAMQSLALTALAIKLKRIFNK